MDLGANPLYFTSPNASWRSGDGVPGQFPAGLRVLVVDDDPTCLMILEKMLKNCLYEVTTCNRAEIALDLLRENRNGYDIVISDVHMPDMDGFKLLEHVGLEMDLPVIMMSADDSKNVVMKGVTHGACDYLIKPVRMEALKNIWQHLVRRKKHEWKEKDFEQSASADEQKLPDDVDYSSSANNEGSWTNSKKRKDEEDEGEERDDTSTLKKPRVVWSVELHQQFVTAVNQLGIDKAVPKKILELMNVPGLTRENVASHLQKYRLYLRRLSGVSHHHNGFPNPFIGPPDLPFGPLSSLNGVVDLQAVAASGQLPPQSLATIQAAALGQRNIFSFENPKMKFVDGPQQQYNTTKKVNLLHGIPTNMDSKQLATLHQSAGQPFAHVNIHAGPRASQNNSLLAPMVQVQAQPRTQNVNEFGSSVSQSQPVAIPSQPVLGLTGIDNVTSVDFASQSLDFSGSSCSLARNAGMLSLASKPRDEVNGPRGLVPNYDGFGYLNQNKNRDWRLQDVGSSVPGCLDVLPPVLIQQPFSSNQKSGRNVTNIGQQINSSLPDNPSRIKDERMPNTGFQNGLSHEQFGQEDLMSALLKEQQEGVGPIENEFSFDAYHLDNLPV